MHLLAAIPGTIADGGEAIDLGQTPGDIVVLSAADSDLAGLALAKADMADFELRLASLLALSHHLSVDLYVERMIRHAKLVCVRLLGGRGYWSYGVEQLVASCRAHAVPLVFLPGDDQPDPELTALSSLPTEAAHRLWQYLVQGGPDNARQFLCYAASLIGRDRPWREPAPLPVTGLYPTDATLADWRAARDRARALAILVVYRAQVQSSDTAAVDALRAALAGRGLDVLTVFVNSLKDPLGAALVAELCETEAPDIVLNATAFSVAGPGRPRETPFAGADCPVLQVIFASSGEAAWREGKAGLSARDIAMHLALPEVDGRIVGRAVSFKKAAVRSASCQCDIARHQPVADRIAFVADLAAAWAALRRKAPAERRVALLLANYPNRDGRMANGVGLDTPASAIVVLAALAGAGYAVDGAPPSGAALMTLLAAGPTNAAAAPGTRVVREVLPFADYQAFFATLPDAVRRAVVERWGPAEPADFAISGLCFGHVFVGVQPARGYNIDPVSSYHDPALVPPHSYLAFYGWLRRHFAADAVVHLGKHGNLEWLPGKAVALSDSCFPEVALGPLPHLYPFIVNDPGEGTQAKRRAQAVIVDHLTPPLTRAESYGPLARLEALVDEYYEAANLDPRRTRLLKEEIVALTRTTGLDADLGLGPASADDDALCKLDNHLCELKEMQIRDGLHILGRAPEGRLLTDLLVALARAPRGQEPAQQSLTRALAADLGLEFDPLDGNLGLPWTGQRPPALAGDGVWRTHGDTVERLETLAAALVAGTRAADPDWTRTAAVLAWIDRALRPAVVASGPAELAGLLAGLDGRFVPPGPSGAPSRGRPDVLPTGRNFYSLDSRAVPTPAAWTLGWKSAGLLVERHLQEHGAWPTAIAITAWGTSAMRTGGDDIAQALALMGVRPCWEVATGRVTGFEIMPAGVLDRPRVDVTLRVSGFFRDAFPGLIDLFDSASRAVAGLAEDRAVNPLAERVRMETARLCAAGCSAEEAARQAGFRVFGSKPGAYGAGLQALIDERGWQTADDLARAYIAWGGFAYGAGAGGATAHGLFETRLASLDAVVQNQDNREHDLLDSDDYYQFEGGMAAAVTMLSGRAPAVYHPDHSRPHAPSIKTLEEEIARVVRSRAANPKWLAGVMRHGYKGAFEIAATLDYLFAFAATTGAVKDHHFDALFDAYLGDETVVSFMAAANPAALRELAERFEEAQQRGLWRSRRNDVGRRIDRAKGERHE
jgi:cobaltochelatase CobN